MNMKTKLIVLLASVIMMGCKSDDKKAKKQDAAIVAQEAPVVEKPERKRKTRVNSQTGANEIVNKANEYAILNAEIQSLIYDLKRDFKQLEK